MQPLSINLPEDIQDSNYYTETPFRIFEINDFLEKSDYESLVKDVNSRETYNKSFSGRGEKEKFSIGGHNIASIKEPALVRFCEFFLSNDFYDWFVRTHLKYFKSHKIKILVRNKKSWTYKVLKKIKNLFSLPVSFYHVEIEYSSIKKGAFIPPHTDSLMKRLSFVYYLPSENLTDKMKSDLGTVFYKVNQNAEHWKISDSGLLDDKKTQEFFRDAGVGYIAKYEANKVAGFIKSDISWHGVKANEYDYDRKAIVINVWEG